MEWPVFTCLKQKRDIVDTYFHASRMTRHHTTKQSPLAPT